MDVNGEKMIRYQEIPVKERVKTIASGDRKCSCFIPNFFFIEFVSTVECS